MGIVEKQATRNAIFAYLGAGLGFFTMLSQAHLFTTDENGLFRILIAVSALFAQLSTLGFTIVTVKFLPQFKGEQKGNNGFLLYCLLVSLIGFGICYSLYYVYKDEIIAYNIGKSKLIVDYLFYLMPLTFFTMFFFVFDAYLRACLSSVVGSLSKDFLQRVFILIAIGLFFFEIITFSQFMFGFVTAQCLPTLILIFSIVKNGEWKILPTKGVFTKDIAKKMFGLAVFSILSTFSGAIILFIDVIMVYEKIDLNATGVYSIAFALGSLILIPHRSIVRITSALVAKAFNESNMIEVKELYNKTSNNLLTIGLFLFIGITVNIDNILQLIPDTFSEGKYVIVIISAGCLFELATGVSRWIILNSKHYYFDTVLVVITIFIAVYANNKLIPIYSLNGAAMATAGVYLFSNLLRLLIIWWKFKIQPFDKNTLVLVSTASFAFAASYVLPEISNFILDTICRSLILISVYLILILKLEAAPEINAKIRKALKRKINI